MQAREFLSAEWRHLVMINYEVEPAILMPYVPKGTELDLWQGRAYVSLVGFMFLNTRVRGVSVPFHRNFEEVNLRFYVKGAERGVTFIKEIVPRWGLAFIARRLYNENYVALPMRHKIELGPAVEYEWKFNGKWQKIGVRCSGAPKDMVEGSEEEFIAEHYWGYTAHGRYEVKHPKWRVWKANSYEVDVDVEALYGPEFAPFFKSEPASVFLAEGSPIQVYPANTKF